MGLWSDPESDPIRDLRAALEEAAQQYGHQETTWQPYPGWRADEAILKECRERGLTPTPALWERFRREYLQTGGTFDRGKEAENEAGDSDTIGAV